MSSSKPERGGPYVTQAIFCERVLQEKDGVLSPIRVIDTVTTRVVPLSEEAKQQVQKPDKVSRKLYALLTIKSGGVKGKRTVRLACESLSLEMSMPIVLEGGYHGMNLVIEMNLEIPEGVHWFSVYVSGRLATRFPLRAVIQLGEVESTQSESTTAAQA